MPVYTDGGRLMFGSSRAVFGAIFALACIGGGLIMVWAEPGAATTGRSEPRLRDLSAQEALAIARKRFPEVMTEPVFDATEPVEGVRVEEFRGDAAALVTAPGARRPLLMQSSVPTAHGPGPEQAAR